MDDDRRDDTRVAAPPPPRTPRAPTRGSGVFGAFTPPPPQARQPTPPFGYAPKSPSR